MDQNFTKKEQIVGVFILSILVLSIATVLVIGLAKDWFQSYVTYYVMFKESYNLQENAPVKLYKADIGKVKKITPEEDKVRIKLVILQKHAKKIRTDSIATVESPTFIGSEYISIKPGKASSQIIEEGREIPSQEKKSIFDFIEEFQIGKIGKAIAGTAQDIAELAKNLREPVYNFQKIISRIEKDEELILSNVKLILGNIEKASKLAPKLMDQMQTNLSGIKDIEVDTHYSIKQIKNILKGVEENLNLLKVTLTNIEKSSYDVPKITKGATERINEARQVLEKLDNISQAVQKNFIIRNNLPEKPEPINIDAGLRK
ncbi:MAG: MCE family protein [Desulfobacterales bacterium]|nr:MCE family protein [Desulfobacterales bacterium]MBF0395286.1 MCE family protein [Desulfobacterales bacterium]